MFGLILKDLFNLKKQFIIVLSVILLFAVFGFFKKDFSFVSSFMFLVLMASIISAWSYDEYSKFDKYIATMPVSRKNTVIARYILSFILTALIFLTVTIISLITKEGENIIIYFALMCASSLIFNIIAPFMYKFGSQTGRIIILVIFAVFGAAAFIVYKQMMTVTFGSLKIPFIILIVSAVLSYIISPLISVKIYEKKEF